ncbi:TPA: hypothetical protein HNC39_03250 [Escherichia coli]|nr:hypothetical protein [Escherichia coli]
MIVLFQIGYTNCPSKLLMHSPFVITPFCNSFLKST